MIIVDGVEMVDVREAATLVRRTPETVRRWVWSSRLHAVKHGNKLMVPRHQLLEVGGDAAVGSSPTANVESDRSLSAWVEEVDRTLTGGGETLSARELVLADRAARR